MVLAAFSGGRLFASAEGEAWRPLRQAFEGADVVSLALSPGPGPDWTLLAGTIRPRPDGGGEVVLWRSCDGGDGWERWLVERGADLLPLAVPPAQDAEVVFAGLGNRVLRPLPRTREVRSGEHRPIWRQVDCSAGAATVTALVASPTFRDDRTLFAATSSGVFVSRDSGETFSPWSEGLAPPPVVALAIAPHRDGSRQVFALGLHRNGSKEALSTGT